MKKPNNIEKEKEASINEMNDYMNNYAHLTFDEYRRMKNGEPLDKKETIMNYEKRRIEYSIKQYVHQLINDVLPESGILGKLRATEQQNIG